MPSLTLDVDQLSVQKVGFTQALTYGTNFNLALNLVKSGIAFSANAADTATIVLYSAQQRNSAGAVPNLCVVGAPSLLVSGGINYLSVNVSLLTSQLAALVQTPGNTIACLMHVTYTQSDGEIYAITPDISLTVAPNLTLTTAGTAAQAPAGYPNPVNIQVYNPIINGDFSVNQRLNTLTTLGSTSVIYAMDKWKIQTSALSAGRFTVTQDQQTVIANLPFVSPDWTGTSSIKIACTTLQASPAAGDFATLSQFIESALWTPMLNQPFSVGFLYKTNVTATLSFFVLDQALAYNFCIPFALTGDGNWHYASATILQPPTLATWNINDAANGFSAKIGFCFFVGSTLTAAANNAWNTSGGDVGAIGTGNFLSANTNTLQITQVAISPGSFAQPWGQLPPPQNYQLCKRYYRKSYPYTVAPGTANASGPLAVGVAATTSTAACSVSWDSAPMRASATPTLYSTNSGTSGKSFDIVGAADITSTAGQPSEQGFSSILSAAAFTTGHTQIAHWTQDVDY